VNALPFPLPALSRGYAELGAAGRAAGEENARRAAAAVAALLATEVEIDGRPLPSPATPAAGMARAAVALEALGTAAVLEVEATLLARAVEAMGGTTCTPGALRPTATERAVLDLAVLAALGALSPETHRRLAPRLGEAGADAPPAPADALAVALELRVGGERGRGRLLLPPAAVAAFSAPPREDAPGRALALGALLCDGQVTLDRAELAALGPGDVLLLDPVPAARLVLPGGLTLAGDLEEGRLLTVKEIQMADTQLHYPITLTVEVARVTVTVGELARLEPGAALPLDVRRDGAVVLRAGDRAIARGQLVEVGGALGVRIAELEAAP
jgi:type III secretion protein Q